MSEYSQEEDFVSIDVQINNYKRNNDLKNEILDSICSDDDKSKYKKCLESYSVAEKLRDIKYGKYIRYLRRNREGKCYLHKGGFVMTKNGRLIVLKSAHGRTWTIIIKDCLFFFYKKSRSDILLQTFMKMGIFNDIKLIDSDDDDEEEDEDD